MEFRILGPLEIRSESGLKHDLAGKQRALLAVLLLHADEAVSTDRLIDALWADARPDTAGKALQVYVSRLRKLLEPDGKGLLVTRPPGYALQLGSHELDLRRFERLRGEARAAAADGDPATAEAKLGEALSLWRGAPLADLALEPFAHTEIARLEELRLLAVEDRNEALLALGRHAEVIAETEALIADHPLRERLRAQLILALYRSRRQAEALEVYQQARRALVDELGIEPSPELQELERGILRQDPSLELAPHVTATERPVPGRRAAGTFVGRTWELETLDAGLDDAFAGRGRLFLAVGEPGIGKSRLADEFASRAKQREAGVLWGRCWEGDGASPYWVWAQALRSYARASDPDVVRTSIGPHAAQLAQLVPELDQLYPELPAAPESTRFELFESVAAFLRSAAREQTLVLVLDDLHAADEPSLLLLRFLAAELAELPIVVLGTYREDIDRDSAALAELRRLPARQLRLGGLAPAEVTSFVEASTGVAPSKKLVDAVHTETEGNPLYVGEVVRLLAAEGRLAEAPGADWLLQIPASVHEETAQRLRALSKECRRVLTIASALGREFDTEVLERVSEASEEEVLEGLDEAFAARVLTEVPGAPKRMRFARDRLRDAVYNDLSTARRARLHLRIGRVLEELNGADDLHLDELALHFFLAGPGGDVEKTVDYSRRAGERAAGLLAFDEAVRHYEHALKALERRKDTDDREKCELYLALADGRKNASQPAEAKDAYLAAAELARGAQLVEQLARAERGYAGGS
jgi:DNA-binding SARP family transcriptional activator